MAGEPKDPRPGAEMVLSVDEVARQAQAIAGEVSRETIAGLAGGAPMVQIDDLVAGYGPQ